MRRSARLLACARARASRDASGWILDERGVMRAPHQRVRQRRARGEENDAVERRGSHRRASRRSQEAARDRAAGRHEEGPVRARGRARASVRGDRARVRGRAGRVRAARPALGPRARLGDARRSTARRSSSPTTPPASGSRPSGVALPEGGDAALRADLGDRARRGRGRDLRGRRPRRAVREPRRRRDVRAQPRRCGSTRRGRSGSRAAGGLCLHSIVTWPGDPDRLAVGISAGRRLAHR